MARLDTTGLLGAGVATTRNDLLKKIWRSVDLYNMYHDNPMWKGRRAAALLDNTMLAIVQYLTVKPPQGTDKNKRRWKALAELGKAILKEVERLGFKLMGMPDDMKTMSDALEDTCFFLERADTSHRHGQDLSDEYRNWRIHAKSVSSKQSFWDFVGAGGDSVTMMDEETRSQFQLHYDEGIWKNRDDNPASTLGSGDNFWDGKGFAIFVASTKGELFTHDEAHDVHHSSFLAGGAVLAAGGIYIRDGRIRLITANSGHYQTTPQNMKRLVDLVIHIPGDGGIQPVFDPEPGKAKWYRIAEFRSKGEAATPLTKDEIKQLKETSAYIAPPAASNPKYVAPRRPGT